MRQIRISILITHEALIAAIGNARYMFHMVNGFLQEAEREPLFDVKLVGKTKKIGLNRGLFTIQADDTLEEVEETDLIIIPPMGGDMQTGVRLNKEYISWVKQQYQKGAEVASLCVGAFILAATGLLNGKPCSTHWLTANEFRRRFPEVRLVEDKVITDDDGLYTSGGANSYWNLLVYLIEKYVDHDMAVRTSKYFGVEMDRVNQSPFMIFEGCKMHDDETVQQAQKYIETHYQDKITVDQLVQMSCLGRRTFHRRFKKATHFTIVEYMQKVKAEAAKKLLESDRLTVTEVMFEVGYNDPKAFREVFKKVTGVTPLEYRNSFSEMLAG